MKRRDLFKDVAALTAGAGMMQLPLGKDGFPDFKAVSDGRFDFLDISQGVGYFLKDDLKQVFDDLPETKNIVYQTVEGGIRDTSVVRFFGAKTKDLRKGCAYLAKTFTQLHEKYEVVARLGPGGIAVELHQGGDLVFNDSGVFYKEKEKPLKPAYVTVMYLALKNRDVYDTELCHESEFYEAGSPSIEV